MPSKEFIIDRYIVVHSSGGAPKRHAMILLINAESTAITKLYFVHHETDIVSTHLNEKFNSSSAYYPIGRFSEVLDILRNESPLTSKTLQTIREEGFVGIHSEGETPGEGEL